MTAPSTLYIFHKWAFCQNNEHTWKVSVSIWNHYPNTYVYLNSMLLTYSDSWVCASPLEYNTLKAPFLKLKEAMWNSQNIQFIQNILMQPLVQPPGLTKSVVLLLWQHSLQTHTRTHQLPSLRHDNKTEICLRQLAGTGKDTLHREWEGRSEFVMDPNREQQLIYTMMSPTGALPKQRRNQRCGWGGYFCLSIFYFLHSSRTSCFAWKH